MKISLSWLPAWVKTPLKRARFVVTLIAYSGSKRFCPVCGKTSRRFKPYGMVRREEARCVHCGALERHRLVWLFFREKTDIFDGKPKKMLHVAPESCFESRFKKQLGSHYLTADLLNPRAMVKMNICDIKYPDSTFDVIYCSHVLEHVLDDKKAIREFYRVLKPEGWAILNVPVIAEKTFEDSSIVDPEDRFKAFGHDDHVRCYGPDYVERLRDSGFTVEVIGAEDLVSREAMVNMGLAHSGSVYYCTK